MAKAAKKQDAPDNGETAPISEKASEMQGIFLSMLQVKMQDEDKAFLRSAEGDESSIVYTFSNGYIITAERKKVENLEGEDRTAYLNEVFAARRPPE